MIDGQIASDAFRERLEMAVHDIATYGTLLARARQAGLAGSEPTFMAQLRKNREKSDI